MGFKSTKPALQLGLSQKLWYMVYRIYWKNNKSTSLIHPYYYPAMKDALWLLKTYLALSVFVVASFSPPTHASPCRKLTLAQWLQKVFFPRPPRGAGLHSHTVEVQPSVYPALPSFLPLPLASMMPHHPVVLPSSSPASFMSSLQNLLPLLARHSMSA